MGAMMSPETEVAAAAANAGATTGGAGNSITQEEDLS